MTINPSDRQPFLLDVWHHASRHIEITEFTQTLFERLCRVLPVGQMGVRRLHLDKNYSETVAIASLEPNNFPPARTDFLPGDLQKLLGHFQERPVYHTTLTGNVFNPARLAVPQPTSGEVLTGLLGDIKHPCGLLFFVAAEETTFAPEHFELVESILDPFSTALENDQRLREMAALREAAEADKRSLLTRLGRKKLGDVIVGAESGLKSVLSRVELVAPSDAPVLIFGETGTGKELIARAIHNRSQRSPGPFHRVNCGAIPPELIDSQLFGHERGAFTGAVESRRGWFERADGGTLFLDEIGELPPAAQVRMLRILQDGWLERVGSEHSLHVNVRIIAATHRDLAGMVADGRFREDLWYRIAVFPIVLPTLRERREDIASMTEHFAERAATRFGLAQVHPTSADIELLASYPWPGNVRELAAVIDRAAILGEGKTLEVAKALGVQTIPGRPATVADTPSASPITPAMPPTPEKIEPLNVVIRRHIENALTACKGRVEGPHGAAKLLQINPHTLRGKMRKLKIQWQEYREK